MTFASHPIDRLTKPQRALLRLVCWVAMADGEFAEQERQLLEKLVARLLPVEADAAADAVQALEAGTVPGPDLQVLVGQLGDADERQLAVKLAFQMACSSQGPEDASRFNTAEKRAYRRLVEALNLPETEVAEAEWAARQELQQKRGLLQLIGAALGGEGAWPALDTEANGLPPGYWL
ncbi:TerB family tellurite resistance protein [Synechococcus sp. GFB01]|uniref:tellurite resistance TerB family protein n=1 Tax=Synechococcus sp. GFB01 TaxID=1662190 RepID=UPI00064FA97B|nr:TerB family tellurite resistance protein [Synechococcus sp. GFB01]KMM17182.1 hypothetical protein SYNGFB01_05900 [Synechococcus sp. GFB01]